MYQDKWYQLDVLSRAHSILREKYQAEEYPGVTWQPMNWDDMIKYQTIQNVIDAVKLARKIYENPDQWFETSK